VQGADPSFLFNSELTKQAIREKHHLMSSSHPTLTLARAHHGLLHQASTHMHTCQPRSTIVGPCGPCSELYFDFHPERGTGDAVSLEDDSRFIEFYNLVSS
jgi:hypothetical protein